MFQAQSDDEAVKLALVVREAVKEFRALDTSSLEKFINRDWLFFTRMFYSPVKVFFISRLTKVLQKWIGGACLYSRGWSCELWWYTAMHLGAVSNSHLCRKVVCFNFPKRFYFCSKVLWRHPHRRTSLQQLLRVMYKN